MKRVLLVGAGHAHMVLLARAESFRSADIGVTLIAPGNFWYGGSVAALLAGRAPRDRRRIRLSPWCGNRGIDLQVGRVVGLNTDARRVGLANGAMLDYDAVSINVGFCHVEPAAPDRTGLEPSVWDGASAASLERLRSVLATDCARGARPRIAIAGGDTLAAEVAAGLAGADVAGSCRLSLYTDAHRLVPGAPRGAAQRLARELSRRGVDIVFNTAIERLYERAVISGDGRRFPADHVVMGHRVAGKPLIHATGLPASDDGLQVDTRLCSPLDSRVFASGGCAYLMNHGPLWSGDSERQAATLAHNLSAVLTGKTPQHYRCARRPCLIDFADGTGIGWAGPLWWHGPVTARAHNRRRERFRRRLQAQPAS